MDTSNVDSSVILNLLNYMEIEESDNKITLDKKLNAKALMPKSAKQKAGKKSK